MSVKERKNIANERAMKNPQVTRFAAIDHEKKYEKIFLCVWPVSYEREV